MTAIRLTTAARLGALSTGLEAGRAVAVRPESGATSVCSGSAIRLAGRIRRLDSSYLGSRSGKAVRTSVAQRANMQEKPWHPFGTQPAIAGGEAL
jgi:hypothetical protein